MGDLIRTFRPSTKTSPDIWSASPNTAFMVSRRKGGNIRDYERTGKTGNVYHYDFIRAAGNYQYERLFGVRNVALVVGNTTKKIHITNNAIIIPILSLKYLTIPFFNLVGFLAAIGVGALVGMFNGFVICKTDIPPFIVTLALPTMQL